MIAQAVTAGEFELLALGAKQKQRAAFHVQGAGNALHRNQNEFFRIPDHGNRFGDTYERFVINCGLVHGNLLSFIGEVPEGGKGVAIPRIRFCSFGEREKVSPYRAAQFYKGKQ